MYIYLPLSAGLSSLGSEKRLKYLKENYTKEINFLKFKHVDYWFVYHITIHPLHVCGFR